MTFLFYFYPSYWTVILLPKMKEALDLGKRHGNDCVRDS